MLLLRLAISSTTLLIARNNEGYWGVAVARDDDFAVALQSEPENSGIRAADGGGNRSEAENKCSRFTLHSSCGAGFLRERRHSDAVSEPVTVPQDLEDATSACD